MEEFTEVLNYVQELLIKNNEWIERFKNYADKINHNIDNIKIMKSNFNLWNPLFLYLNISESKKSSPKFYLRYHGQDVASLSIKGSKITISTKGYDKDNYFNCPVILSNEEWNSAKAREFRKHYLKNPDRNLNLPKKIIKNEHRIESLLLTAFSNKSRSGKILENIQPVKLAGIARFQMPTPLGASKFPFKYSTDKGGGIDILARVGNGPNTKLCIMEIKDEYKHKDDPIKALKQGLAYAVFIRELLRSDSGEKWWKLFGFNHSIPKSLKLYVACVMKLKNNQEIYDSSFKGNSINIGEDSIQFHYLYFEENNNTISKSKIKTSLK
mgnify:CR=1 FL=1